MTVRSLTVLTALLVLPAAAFAQGPRRDGKWEVKMQTEMPGMPMQMPPVTLTQCITKEQAADPQKSMPQVGPGGRGDGFSRWPAPAQELS